METSLEKIPIKLAVKEITGFILQSGSIDNRFGGGRADRMQLGGRIHRQLQKEAGALYKAEVSLSLLIPFSGDTYLLEGRADGVFIENELTFVDEIKSTSVPIASIQEDHNPAHWGQVFCYAYMLAVTQKLERIVTRLTYVGVDSGEIKYFYREETIVFLEQFVLELLEEYKKWKDLQIAWKVVRNDSIKSLSFPFLEYRRGQRELSVAVYRTVQQSGRLFCQAPTGIGKTISTLFPSIKAMGEGHTERIFYLTAKTITRQAAEDAFVLLRKGGLRAKTIMLTAKDKICFLEERNCNPEVCPYADGYYDRVRDVIYSMLSAKDSYTRAVIEESARENKVCPFELSLDLSSWCDGIVCDYNYLFDPIASLQRFFSDRPGEYVFLIDEAHNLVDRARDMYTAVLSKTEIMELKKAVGKGGELSKALLELNSQMVAVRKLCGERGFYVEEKPTDSLCRTAMRFYGAATSWLEEHKEQSPLRKQVLEQFFAVSFFLRILELYDEHYCSFYQIDGRDTTAKLLCIDPSALLDQRLLKGKSAVFFSATLSPLDYFREVLGGGEKAKRYSLPSPFLPQNLCLLCANKISTKYRDRENSLEPIAELLFELVVGKVGNYLVYFPSYRYLKDVYEVFHRRFQGIETIVQTGDMDNQMREDFLLRFDAENQSTLLGFCVMGGVFSEGVDLAGDRLIGTAIVGVGLPQIGPVLNHMRDYFNKNANMGYEYIYRYPGMNKVLQAAGRVIRGENDRGVVLLIDTRFTSISYQSLFPEHWGHWKAINSKEALGEQLANFWGDL